MPTFAPNFITAIDVGSAKTTVLVAELSENGLRYRGHGVSESRGLRKGVITELDKAAGSIQKAVEVAEDVAGIPIEHAIVGIAGAHIRGMNSHGGITFGARAREIGRDEIRQAVDKARTVPLPADREILHLLPQEFTLDDQPGVQDPNGMMATRMEVHVHIVTALSGATQNLVTAVNKAGVHVDDTIFEPLACADSVLRPDERELGVCLADLGAGSCDLIVFQQGAVAHTAVIPIGGDHFTSDLSIGMCTGLADAEMLKKIFGNAVPTLIPEGNEVEVPSVGDRPSRMMPQRMIGEILGPRARELFELVRENLRQAGVLDHCIAGFVLSGGASRLPGLLDVAESILRKAARLAWPTAMAKMPASLAEPEFATVLGMVYYGHRARLARGLQEPGFGSRMKALFAKKGA
ncbi:MAG: cell division protein FtsA [Terriglobales bacterium]